MSDYPISVSSGRAHQGRVTSGNAAGPPLPMMAIIFAALFLASVVGVGAAAGAHLPSPFDPVSKLSAYLAAHRDGLQISSLLQFASAVPLAILRRSRRRPPVSPRNPRPRRHHRPGRRDQCRGHADRLRQQPVGARPERDDPEPGRGRGFQDRRSSPADQDMWLPSACSGGHRRRGRLHRDPARPLALAGIVLAAAARPPPSRSPCTASRSLLPVARFAGYAWIAAAASMLPAARATTAGRRRARQRAPASAPRHRLPGLTVTVRIPAAAGESAGRRLGAIRRRGRYGPRR